MDITQIGIISALVVVVGKLIDILQKFIVSKLTNQEESEDDKINAKLDSILDHVRISAVLQSKVDNDGVPMIYYPRSALEQQRQNNEHLISMVQNVEQNQNTIAKSFERSSIILDNVVRMLTLMEDRIKRN